MVFCHKGNRMGNLTEEQLELQQLANECMDEGIKCLDEGKLKFAETMVSRAKDLFEEINDRHALAQSMNILSIIYTEMGTDGLDLDYLLDALEIALEEEYYDLASRYFNNIGSKYMDVKANELALRYFERALEMYGKAIEQGSIDPDSSHDFQLILNLNLAAIYSEMNDYPNMKLYYEKAKTESLHPDNQEMRFTFQSFEGLLLWRMGEKVRARALVDSIIETAQATEYVTDYMVIMRDLLDLLKEMQDYKRWESTLQLMDAHVSEERGIKNQLIVVEYWLDYYTAVHDEERYNKACTRFVNLSREEEKINLVRSADNITLKLEMRRAMKQKQITDSIVYLDPLTGIGNRNRMLEDSKEYIAQALATHTAIMIGLIDIDYFKECNDTYGHIKGDECLKRVADVIQSAVGDYGNVYRYGGDEFLLLLPNADREDAIAIGDAIKKQLEAEQIVNERSPISSYVTVSQGYTDAYAEEGDTIDQLINLADRVLYSVKRCGRNNYKYMSLDELI